MDEESQQSIETTSNPDKVSQEGIEELSDVETQVEASDANPLRLKGSEELILMGRNDDGRNQKISDVVKTRSGCAIIKPSGFMAVTKVTCEKWREEACKKAVNPELHQLFEDLPALCVVQRAFINH